MKVVTGPFFFFFFFTIEWTVHHTLPLYLATGGAPAISILTSGKRSIFPSFDSGRWWSPSIACRPAVTHFDYSGGGGGGLFWQTRTKREWCAHYFFFEKELLLVYLVFIPDRSSFSSLSLDAFFSFIFWKMMTRRKSAEVIPPTRSTANVFFVRLLYHSMPHQEVMIWSGDVTRKWHEEERKRKIASTYLTRPLPVWIAAVYIWARRTIWSRPDLFSLFSAARWCRWLLFKVGILRSQGNLFG